MAPSGRRRTPPPAFGGPAGYQMDFHNVREGLREARLDVEEGADIIMVKPAMAFGDVIAKVREAVPVPVASYSVSGEYAMVKCAAQPEPWTRSGSFASWPLRPSGREAMCI